MGSKNLAGISLIIMAAGFVACLFLPENTWTFILVGGFEAGLVGGLADWFAVTALFRHPLGIPIPHTSLLLKNKERIVSSLVSAMENELLNKDSITRQLRKLNLVRGAASMLTRTMARKRTRQQVLDYTAELIAKLPLEKAIEPVREAAANYVRGADAAGLADRALTKVLNDGYEVQLFDYALGEAKKWVERPETKDTMGVLALEQLSSAKVGGFTGFAFQAFAGMVNEDKLGTMIQTMLRAGIDSLLDPYGEQRLAILREVRVKLFEAAGDEEKLEYVRGQVLEVLYEESTTAFIRENLERLREFALAKTAEERGRGGRLVFRLYAAVVRGLAAEPGRVEGWEEQVRGAVVQLAENNHYRIGKLVRDNVDRMDDNQLVEMLEEKIGQDIQWIRVNGAVCGFVVGIVLSLIRLI
ncbi:DUF445 domain-containing protein [Saccharibacillus sp. CPCC 101409]|uniref:DUF445 domain-containing protein n=1 Tax=Saccharibacillus sp. CPCC 101409 TaxID=3058041 RepID=UPI0026730E67|nr:DUF445 domain-containing protein [Saccharibacillus sp. CPCC 101409]MDO3411662.1 DUF445 domain-containing protein [Saccharibacillus sp. CPCC 101409]